MKALSTEFTETIETELSLTEIPSAEGAEKEVSSTEIISSTKTMKTKRALTDMLLTESTAEDKLSVFRADEKEVGFNGRSENILYEIIYITTIS